MALVSLLGLFLGAYLTLYKFGFIGTLACGVSSCEQVQTSRWSVFLGLAGRDVGRRLLCADARAVDRRPAGPRFADSRGLSLVMLVLPAGACSSPAWLNYLEAFVIHAWCEWCLGSGRRWCWCFSCSRCSTSASCGDD